MTKTSEETQDFLNKGFQSSYAENPTVIGRALLVVEERKDASKPFRAFFLFRSREEQEEAFKLLSHDFTQLHYQCELIAYRPLENKGLYAIEMTSASHNSNTLSELNEKYPGVIWGHKTKNPVLTIKTLATDARKLSKLLDNKKQLADSPEGRESSTGRSV